MNCCQRPFLSGIPFDGRLKHYCHKGKNAQIAPPKQKVTAFRHEKFDTIARPNPRYAFTLIKHL